MDRFETITAAVSAVIDKYPVGHQFHGNQLKSDAVKLYPACKYAYPDTFLRMARRHRREAFRAVNRNKSLYEKVLVKSITETMRELREKAGHGTNL